MVCLASVFGKDEFYSLRKIAQAEDISFDYLEKIISKLEKADLVRAKRGIRGGYCLSRSPRKINVGEIIKTLEGTMAPVRCVALEKKERYQCPRKRVCKTFNVWQKIRDTLNSTLNSIILADLIKK